MGCTNLLRMRSEAAGHRDSRSQAGRSMAPRRAIRRDPEQPQFRQEQTPARRQSKNRGEFSTGWGGGGDLGSAVAIQYDDLMHSGNNKSSIEIAGAKRAPKEKKPPRAAHPKDPSSGLYLDR